MLFFVKFWTFKLIKHTLNYECLWKATDNYGFDGEKKKTIYKIINIDEIFKI